MTIQKLIYLIPLSLVLIQFTTIMHEIGHAIPVLISSKGGVSIYLGSGEVKRLIQIGKLTLRLRSFDPFTGFIKPDAGKLTKWQNLMMCMGVPP